MWILLKPLGDKGPTDNMNMEDLLDRLLMRLGMHMTGTPSVAASMACMFKLPVDSVMKMLEVHVIKLAEWFYCGVVQAN